MAELCLIIKCMTILMKGIPVPSLWIYSTSKSQQYKMYSYSKKKKVLKFSKNNNACLTLLY